MTNAAVPFFPLNHTHTDLPYFPSFLLPLFSALSYPTVIIYHPLFFMPSIHLCIPHFFPSPLFNSLSLSRLLFISLSSFSLSVSHRGSAIENLHMIVINGFDLFGRLSLPPPFAPSLSHPRRFQCGSPQPSGLSVFIS